MPETKRCILCNEKKTGGVVVNKKPVCYGCITVAIITFTKAAPTEEKLDEFLNGIVEVAKNYWKESRTTVH